MATPGQPAVKGKGKRVSPTMIILVLGVALAGGAYLLYRQRKTAAAASSSAAAPDTSQLEDFAGQIATLQTEIGDLQSSAAQDEKGETGTGTGPRVVSGPPVHLGPGDGGTGTVTALKAPAGLSVSPHKGGANFGWSTVPGARAYELEVTGAGGKGTGTSHYDHASAGNHAENVALARGAYKARVRAGTSTAALSGPWTPYKPFTVPAR